MNLIEELEEFINGHKARSMTLHVDDGYGSSPWTLEISTEIGDIRCVETAGDMFEEIGHDGELLGIKYLKTDVTKPYGVRPYYTIYAEENGFRGGLQNVIEKGLNFAKMLVIHQQKKAFDN